jgi:hypothetical protein
VWLLLLVLFKRDLQELARALRSAVTLSRGA